MLVLAAPRRPTRLGNRHHGPEEQCVFETAQCPAFGSVSTVASRSRADAGATLAASSKPPQSSNLRLPGVAAPPLRRIAHGHRRGGIAPPRDHRRAGPDAELEQRCRLSSPAAPRKVRASRPVRARDPAPNATFGFSDPPATSEPDGATADGTGHVVKPSVAEGRCPAPLQRLSPASRRDLECWR
jgi:hypothetical protein